jgi:hypothetical protein
MNRTEEILALEGCSVHVEKEILQPREHRNLRGRGGEAQIAQMRQMWFCLRVVTQVEVLCGWTVLLTSPISSINRECHFPLTATERM